MGDSKSATWPPTRVSPEDDASAKKRAADCGLTLTEYIRYRVLGKRVLTGDQLERVKKHERPVD